MCCSRKHKPTAGSLPPLSARCPVVSSSPSAAGLVPAWANTSPRWWWRPSWSLCCLVTPCVLAKAAPSTASGRPTTCRSSRWRTSTAWPCALSLETTQTPHNHWALKHRGYILVETTKYNYVEAFSNKGKGPTKLLIFSEEIIQKKKKKLSF